MNIVLDLKIVEGLFKNIRKTGDNFIEQQCEILRNVLFVI